MKILMFSQLCRKAFEKRSFAYCRKLTTIDIPDSVTEIGIDWSNGVFEGCDDLTIICGENSAAHEYAVENFVKFKIREN